MTLNIEKASLIKEAQREFNLIYPYLKIEFFKAANTGGGNKSGAEKNHGPEPVGIREIFSKSARIDIDGQKTVSELENDFKKLLGLSVKLYRKSANMWIQTTLTNNWSLKKQNEEGEFMSSPGIREELKADTEESWMEPE